MMRIIYAACLFLCSYSAWAATETFEVYHLPLSEAEALIQTQLSASGSIATLASRRMIVATDDTAHLKKARALLKKMDVQSTQYTLYMDVMEVERSQMKQAQASAVLPGGWIQLHVQASTLHSNHHQRFQLHLVDNKQGMVEVGKIQPSSEHIRQWLAGYGVIEHDSVELVSLTSGLMARVWGLKHSHVHVSIQPWVRQQSKQHIQGQTEFLLDLGTTQKPKKAPSNLADLRLNAQPIRAQAAPIHLVRADTELMIPLHQTVNILANEQDAVLFSHALFAQHIGTEEMTLLIQLRIEKSF